MREIKFRAWDKEKQEMYFDSDCNCCVWDEIRDRSILMQYTGLKDKNGVEVYEGDVVVLKAIWGGFQATIIFQDGCFGVMDGCAVYTFQDMGSDSLEVIGNIHNNSELVEAKDGN